MRVKLSGNCRVERAVYPPFKGVAADAGGCLCNSVVDRDILRFIGD